MDGIIIVNKEENWTSNDVVQKVKHIFNEKVGHTGTLDPLATGVLPLLIGKGTLLSKYLINHDKEYIATIKLGIKTDSADSEGKVIEKKQVEKEMLNSNFVLNILKKFIGKQTQIPPMYSAIKVNGKKLYEYARKGQSVEIEPRNIEIYNIELIEINNEENEIKYKVNCSKGTYIRTLSEDIAKALGTIGFMKSLNRTKVGNFSIEQALKISELEQNIDKLNSFIITIESFFKNNGKIILTENQMQRFLNGVKLNFDKEDDIYRIYNESNKFIGVGVIQNNLLKRELVVGLCD